VFDGPVTGRFRAGDIRTCFADIGKARALLGYEPSVPLSAGLAGVVSWLRGNAGEDRTDEALSELEARRLTR
jgi:dTDP-L-rhamnose 4-epimerase